MPRDGSNIYHQPFPNVVTNTPVASTVYNGFTADVTQDLNTPRPIVAGGTGATTAQGAITNLGGEVAKQSVTNFDSFPFVSGSFTSLAGATGAPSATNGYFGIYYENANGAYATLEARDQVTGSLSVRHKFANVWNAWNAAELFSYDLKIEKTTPLAILSKTASGQDMGLYGQLSGKPRWFLSMGNNSAESGSNVGSNFGLSRYDDAGNFIDTPLSILRSDGTASFGHSLGVTGTLSVAVPTSTFALNLVNNSVSKQKGFRVGTSAELEIINNANTSVIASLSDTGTLNVTADVGASGGFFSGGALIASKSGNYNIFYSAAGNAAVIAGNATDPTNYYRNTKHSFDNIAASETFMNMSGAGLNRVMTVNPSAGPNSGLNCSMHIAYAGGGTQFGLCFRPAGDTTTAITFVNASSGVVGSITQTTGATTYNTSSDVRLKEDFRSFDAGGILDRIEVHDFAWIDSKERAHGIAAQQVNEVYPQAVTHIEHQDVDWWGVDYSKFVPLLLAEIKALRARVATLEAR